MHREINAIKHVVSITISLIAAIFFLVTIRERHAALACSIKKRKGKKVGEKREKRTGGKKKKKGEKLTEGKVKY